MGDKPAAAVSDDPPAMGYIGGRPSWLEYTPDVTARLKEEADQRIAQRKAKMTEEERFT
jgi:hypothetical protein